MKKKISPNQLELLPIGEGENAKRSFTSWKTRQLIDEVNSLYSIAKAARADYTRNKVIEKDLVELSKVKHSRFGKIRGEIYDVKFAKYTLGFLARFRSDQKIRIEMLRKYCAELKERGADTTIIDQFCDVEGF